MARSLIRDQQLIDAHFIRWVNAAYRNFARLVIVPKLNSGDPVELIVVDGSTQRFYLPYDFVRAISFYDSGGRTLDILPSEDVRQINEYGSLGSFTQFYEHNSANVDPVYNSVDAAVTIEIDNRSTLATTSSAILIDDYIGEWILPINRNTTAGSGNPEDYGYLISDVPTSSTLTLARPFRGVISDSGSIGDLSTSYFEIRPRNTPIIRIWGDPGTEATINCEYQRTPSKIANDEDIPEEPRLSEAIVYEAIKMAGWSYKDSFQVKIGQDAVSSTLSSFQKSKDFDRLLIRNYIVGNPNARTYSQGIGTRHIGMDYDYSPRGIRY